MLHFDRGARLRLRRAYASYMFQQPVNPSKWAKVVTNSLRERLRVTSLPRRWKSMFGGKQLEDLYWIKHISFDSGADPKFSLDDRD
jgi:hypothetical protein